MRLVKWLMPVMFMIMLSGCATVSSGPNVRVLPPPGKPYDLFMAEDSYCRQMAERQIGITPQEVANQNTATGAVIGSAAGAGLGAAIGSASGNAGPGAIIGALSGLFVGTVAGSDAGRIEGRQTQRRYDTVYMQCMYSHGNQVYNPGQRYYRRRTVIVKPPIDVHDYVPPDIVPYYPPPNAPSPGQTSTPLPRPQF
jgi:outer membrane lipoprotein SlyB